MSEALPILCTHCGTKLVAGAESCHQCGRRILAARPGWPLRVSLAASMVVTLCSAGVIFIDVETVLGSGPAMMAVAVALLIFSIRQRFVPGVLLGLGHIGICGLFVGLVETLSWGPAPAAVPFSIMATIYTLLTVPLTVRMFGRIPGPDPTRCLTCGYLLLNLTEPRCPECGTAFDPAKLPLLQT